VLQTLVAEVYGPDYDRQIAVARDIKALFAKTPGVVDVDWYVEDPQPRVRLVVDREKAALNGVTVDQVMKRDFGQVPPLPPLPRLSIAALLRLRPQPPRGLRKRKKEKPMNGFHLG
jgi:hypothetical protein